MAWNVELKIKLPGEEEAAVGNQTFDTEPEALEFAKWIAKSGSIQTCCGWDEVGPPEWEQNLPNGTRVKIYMTEV